MVARDNSGGCQDEAIGVGDGQHIRSFSFLARLIGHGFIHFLRGGTTTIEVQVMGVDLLSDAQNAGLKDVLQAAIAAPLALVMIDRMIADFFFVGSSGAGSIGRRSH